MASSLSHYGYPNSSSRLVVRMHKPGRELEDIVRGVRMARESTVMGRYSSLIPISQKRAYSLRQSDFSSRNPSTTKDKLIEMLGQKFNKKFINKLRDNPI